MAGKLDSRCENIQRPRVDTRNKIERPTKCIIFSLLWLQSELDDVATMTESRCPSGSCEYISDRAKALGLGDGQYDLRNTGAISNR